MPNTIEKSDDGVALHVTTPARASGLVTEDSERDLMSLPAVRVYAFNDVLLVVDRDEMDTRTVADLLAVITKDTKSIYHGLDASVQVEDNGVKVQLPPADDAGFAVGDMAVAHSAPDLLVITKQNQDSAQLADELVTMRHDQVTVA